MGIWLKKLQRLRWSKMTKYTKDDILTKAAELAEMIASTEEVDFFKQELMDLKVLRMTSPRLIMPTNTPFLSTGNFLICFFPKKAAIFSISSFQATLCTDFLAISKTFKSMILFALSSNASKSPLNNCVKKNVPKTMSSCLPI